MSARESLSRLEVLVGEAGLEKLAAAHVLVVGLGGVGSHCALALARSGIGTLSVIDFDVVNPSDLNRQAFAFEPYLGRKKVEAFADLVGKIDSQVRVAAFDERVTKENVGDLVRSVGPVDFIVDAIDDVPAKLALAQFCEQEGILALSCMGTAGKWHPEMLRFADIYATEGCPLCRAVRKDARKLGIERMQVLYSSEPVESHPGQPLGSNAVVPPAAGTMLASYVLRTLLGIE